MTTYYASPTGTVGASGLSTSTPFRPQDFWAVAVAGDTLNLMDGTYQGSAYMIAPTTGLSGNGTGADIPNGVCPNCITVRAITEGAVLIDGQFQRAPCRLSQNNWFIFEGFNCKSGQAGAIGTPGAALAATSSNNNIMRRLVAWDRDITLNGHGLNVNDCSNNLFEDLGIFGPGRKGLELFDDSYGNIVRRVWVRWEGNTQGAGGNFFGMTVCYNSSPNNSNGNIFENMLVTWSGESMPQSYTDSSGANLTNFAINGSPWVMGRDNLGDNGTFCHNIKIFGSIGYVKSTTVSPPSGPSVLQGIGTNSATDLSRIANCFTYKDVLMVMSPSHTGFSSSRGFNFGSQGTGNSATFLSSIAGQNDIIPSSWSPSNNKHATTLAGLNALSANPWTGTTGANLCHRYVSGVRTTTPLWPWPMNDRIKAATSSAGAYTGPCPGCVGGRFARTETDVTAEVEALLGTIPTECRTAIIPPAPPVAGGTGDTVTVTDKFTVVVLPSGTTRTIFKIDAVAVSETTTVRLARLTIPVSDVIGVADTIGRLLKSFITEADGVTVSEAVTVTRTSQPATVTISEADAVTVTEFISKLLDAVGEAAPPTVPATGSSAPTISLVIQPSENVGTFISRIRERLHDT